MRFFLILTGLIVLSVMFIFPGASAQRDNIGLYKKTNDARYNLLKAVDIKQRSLSDVAAIAYRAESFYQNPSAVYADARLYTTQATEDLFGAGLNESICAAEAGKAVGVNELLAKPDSISALTIKNTVVVSWTFNNFQSIDGFKIERAINANNQYTTINTVGPNVRSFTDSGYNNNSLNQYRIRSFKDTLNSDYSAVATIATGDAPIIMANGFFITCGSTFLDPGGTGNYSNGYYVTTVRPATPGNNLKIVFSQFNINSFDYLYIYDGPSTSSPLLGVYSGSNIPPVLQSTSPGGELTFAFNSYYANGLSGWQAYINCFKPVTAPSNLKAYADSNKDVHLNWTDNAKDETQYVVERSLNDSFHFLPLSNLPANKINYLDTSAIQDTYNYYRVRAYRDSVVSPYSKSVLVVNGNIFIMGNQPLATCGVTFLDPGGKGDYSYGNYTTTVSSAQSGNNVKVVFSEFNVLYDNLYVYDGTTTSPATLLGVYTGATLPPVLQSSAPGGELTFVFNSYSSNAPGWKAYVSCFKPVLKPTGLTAVLDSSQLVKLRWKDNSRDETKYIVERSVNAPAMYKQVAQLKSNQTKYTDSTAPRNSVLYYRVRAYRDTLASLYSDTAIVNIGDAPFLMQDSTLVTCDKVFLDPAGVDVIPSNTYYNIVTTFKPAITGNNIKVVFRSFKSYGSLYVYNGSSTSSPLIGSYNTYNPPSIVNGDGTSGSLTFSYNAYSYGDSGWVAKVSCYKPVLKPTGLKAVSDSSQLVKLTWKDNANDETRYVLERSVNAPASYAPVAQLKSNQTKYTDSTAPGNSVLYYRVRAYRDTMASFYSDTAIINVGDAPFLMQDSTLVTCDKVFLDPAGVDVIPSNTYYNIVTTFKPAITGNNIKVVFRSFKSYGSLYVYNGSSTSSPLIGSYNTYNPPSIVNGDGTSGSLTFSYNAYSYGDSGWVAKVSCYKPVLKPTGLKAVSDSSQLVKLTWKDNANDETRYVLERSVNAPASYAPVAQLKSNQTKYTDSTAPGNSVLYYRVRAYRDTMASFYSDTAIINVGDAPFLMQDSTLVTCDKVFLDPAGVDVISSNTYYNIITTFKPAIAGNNVKVVFSNFRSYNTLYVYNGPSTNSPLIGSYNTYNPPSAIDGNGADGSLTFSYVGYSYGDFGWVAKISCYKPVLKPTRLTAVSDSSRVIKLTWKDNANDETKYIVERSVNAVSMYKQVAQLRSNANKYTDSTAPDNSILYYRVRAYRDTMASFYSDTAVVSLGNAPFLMKDSTLITCDKVFMSPAGIDIIPSNNYYNTVATFKPAIAGNNVKVVFSKFRLNGTLAVFNGPNTGSALIGRYSGYQPYLSFEGDGADGSLTFSYNGYSYGDSGWIAGVSCFKPVLKPTGLKAISATSRFIKLTWKDNANDETKYIVERAVNAPSMYKQLVQLKSNANKYTDSTAPANCILYYRVKAFRDTLGSFYSDTATISLGSVPFFMKDSTVITCNTIFMDPAAPSVISGNYVYSTATFKPAVAGNNVKVVFSKFKINGTLSVFNGSSTNSPYIGSFNGRQNSLALKGDGPDGSLTFYYGGSSYEDSGWVAQVTCYKPVLKPTGLTAIPDSSRLIKLTWKDNANDETRYVVERAVNGPSVYKQLAQLKPNANKYTDSTAPANSLLYYRVRAYRDTTKSFYSDTALLSFGNVPFLMQDSTLATCDKVFMDPAGIGILPLNTYYNIVTTFKPSIPGNRVKVVFSKFSLNIYGNLYVSNGSTTSSPGIGRYSGYYPSLTFDGNGPDGSLTFNYEGYSNGDSGWVAKVSCYKPVLKPTGLTAISDSSRFIKLTWNDNADDETKYIVERSVNAPSLYTKIAQLKPNANNYTDSTAPYNSILYYRVKAYRDTMESFYSDTAIISAGNAPYLMTNDSTLVSCDKIVMDPGGVDIIPVNLNYNSLTIFKPAVAGNSVKVVFSKFRTDMYMYVYDGSSRDNRHLIGTYTGYYPSLTFEGTGADGSLSFFYEGLSYGDSGWVAKVSCYKPVKKPTNLKATSDSSQLIKLTWKDYAGDETKYVVERSVNAPSKYIIIAQLNPNTQTYTDSAAPENSLLYYRVRAYRDTAVSFYSNVVIIALGNAPFLMKDSTLITCNKVFMDPAGIDVISAENFVDNFDNYRHVTFKPAVAGNKIRVFFSKFMLNGTVTVYNGTSVNSPRIGSYSGYHPSLSFDATGAAGALTFDYTDYGPNSFGDSGWVAEVSCYKPVSAPGGLWGKADTLKPLIKLNWNDNADDETKYVVERAVNSTSKYTLIAQLPSNTNKYTDSTAPANSLLYYRVKAYRDTLQSLYSNAAVVSFGNAPFFMEDSTLITCDKLFLGPSDINTVPQNNYYNTVATFKPAQTGNSVKVIFSKFNVDGMLSVYNGSSTGSPLIGSYYEYSSSLSFQGTGADGSLTFFYSGFSNQDSGWVAQVNCINNTTTGFAINKATSVSSLTRGTSYKWQQYSGSQFAVMAKLGQNSPNPFNRSTIIPCSIPESSKAAMIVIYTIDGKAIKTFTNLSKGINNIEILAKTFVPGIYPYVLLVDGKLVQSRRMIITK